ncbi:MAG: carbohydrate ABC transporter permease [Mediterraneibacter gnavus]
MDQYYKKWSKVLVAPAVILFICIVAIPFIIGVVYSFTSWRGTYFAGGSLTESFVGLDNYIKTFTNEQFRNSFFYTCIFTVLSVVTVNVCAMLLALLVTNIMKGSGIFRTIIFMPNMLGGLALGFIWQFIFQVVFTDILFGSEGFLHIEALRYMTQDPVKALFALLLMTTWQNAGYMMIIYVGGLNAVSTELYEAASLDGASAFQRFRKITLPLLMPSITIVLFLTLSNSFKLLDQNVALTDGEFGTRMLALQILRTLKDTNPPDYGGAQAQAVIFFIVMAIISFIQVSVTRKKEVEM